MKITANIQNNVIALNYGGIGISIDPHTVLNSAKELINVFKILPFPEDVKEEILKNTGELEQWLPILRKFVDSIKYNDSNATIVLNDDGTINIHQSEVHNLVDLPKLFGAIVEYKQFENKLREERRAEREKREAEWEAEQAEREAEFKSELDETRRKNQEQLDNLRAKMQNRYDEVIGTDQSMEEMADNEIVFEERPNAFVLSRRIGDKLEKVTTSLDIRKRASNEGYNIIDPRQPLTGALIDAICDSYGLSAQLNWEPEHATENMRFDKPFNEEETE